MVNTLENGIPLLAAERIEKWYGKIHALRGIDVVIHPGEALALIGDNGAGKSTFAKIVAGVEQKTSGRLLWKGKEVDISSIKQARNLGIETVYQEQALAPQLTVMQNIFLGRTETKFGILGILDNKKMAEAARRVLDELGLAVGVNQEVRFCSGGEQQGVAVARAILFKANLVILDEPTRALSTRGVERILQFIRSMKNEGIAVILISHVFPQIFPITDRFMFMSRGQVIAEKRREETSPEDLSRMIIQKTA
ncbi:sugar ABC transporter ATP-binding protein [Candidatus Bipolaricaulota bacterium]|nr:sugar ABC transporter ATP-binding protein [Candidatus Bipolaricaulota bacterium]